MTLHPPTPLAGGLEALAEDDPRLALLFDSRAAVAFDVSTGRAIYANAAAAQLFGKARPDQVVGADDLLHDDSAQSIQNLGRSFKPDSAPRVERLRFEAGDRTVSLGFTCTPLETRTRREDADTGAIAEEPVIGVLATSMRPVGTAVSDREQAEMLFGQSPVPTILRNEDGEIVYRNTAADHLDDAQDRQIVSRKAGRLSIEFLHAPAPIDLTAQAVDSGSHAVSEPDHSDEPAQHSGTGGSGGLLRTLAGAVGLGGGKAAAPTDKTEAAGVPDDPGPLVGSRFRFVLDQNAQIAESTPDLANTGLAGGVGAEMDDLLEGDPTPLANAIESRDTFNRVSIQWRAADGGDPVNVLLSGLPILDGAGGYHGLRAFGVLGTRSPKPDHIAGSGDTPESERQNAGATAPGSYTMSTSERLERLVAAGAGLSAAQTATAFADAEAAEEPASDDSMNVPADDPTVSDDAPEGAGWAPVEDVPARRQMRSTEETLRENGSLEARDREALDEIAERLSTHDDTAAEDRDADAQQDEENGADGSARKDDDSEARSHSDFDHSDDAADSVAKGHEHSEGVLVPFSRPSGDKPSRNDAPARSDNGRDWARIASAATALGGLGAGIGARMGLSDDAQETGQEADPQLQLDVPEDSRSDDGTAGAQGPMASAKGPALDQQGYVDLVDRLPLGMLFVRDETPLHANRAFLDLFGYADLEDLNMSGGLPALFENLSDTSSPGKRMLTGITSDNRPFQVEARLQLAPWVDGPALLLSIRERDRFDTSPLENADAEIAELRDMLDAVPDCVIVADMDGRVGGLNAAARALLGPVDRAQMPPMISALFAGDDQAAIETRIAGLGDGTADADSEPIRARLVTRNGSEDAVDVLASTIGIGVREKLCVILRDPAPAAAAGGEPPAAEGLFAGSQKSDVLAKVSHEIRTPINAIIGFADMMLDEQYGPLGHERYTGYLKDIKSSGLHIVSLVNDLLDLSKVEAGMLDLDFTETRLNDVVEQCAAIMQSQANRDNVILRTSLAQKLPPVVADIRSIRQILLNLLSNAVKFTDPGGQVIVSTVYTDQGSVELRVRDTGVGMSDDDIAKALEPYKQNVTIGADHPNRGTGLGLPLTKALAEANRAGFAIQSTPGQGTTVHVTFPPTRVLAE